MIQDRVGPNRANVGNYTGNGLLHLAADGLKSIFKEDTIPQGANGFLYLIAPLRVDCMSCNLCNHSDCRADW